MNSETLASLQSSLPPALKREQVVQVFKRCGLGGLETYKKLKATRSLSPLRGLTGAKQARYGKDHVLALCAEALNPSTT